MTIDTKLISLRDLTEADIPLSLNYWFRSPSGFIESLSVDSTKMPTEQEMENGLRNKLVENQKLPTSKLNVLTILYNQQPIGIHPINPIVENDYGVFHAHIWDPKFRRQGIAMHSYPMACRFFFDRFNLKRILFKTPKQNLGAIRVKEKLGIRVIGEEEIDFSIVKKGTIATVFELTREEAMQKKFL